jgi:iron complex transport system permease protein
VDRSNQPCLGWRVIARGDALKIVLDITRLVSEGRLTQEQAAQLTALAARDTGSLLINLLMSFGAVAVAAGILTLAPAFLTGTVIGVALVAIGLFVSLVLSEQWRLLGVANVVIGALMLSGGVIGVLDGRFAGFAFAVILLLGLALVIRNGLLMALAPLALAAALGSSTGYSHASYMLVVREPTMTVVFFALFASAAYLASKQVAPAYERLAIVFARVSLILVNFGFWVGSLWGDHPARSWLRGEAYYGSGDGAGPAAGLYVPDYVFIASWAVLIIGVGFWAGRANRRWVVTTASVFGAIHFYTQWFERLGADPLAVIVAGVIMVAIAVILWRYNTAAARA